MIAPTHPWLMDVVHLNRKRSASTPEPLHDEEASSADSLKRTRTQSELDELDTIPASEAWCIDVSVILSSPTITPAPLSAAHGGNNAAAANYSPGTSIFLLCVQGDYELHHDLLCSALPELYAIYPTLQAFVLCRDPASHTPSSTLPSRLPMVQAISPTQNHFVKLGLLHPLGGGQYPLDALVLLDTKGRRRLVLPFGWGPGRHAANIGGGRIVQARLMNILKKSIHDLRREL